MEINPRPVGSYMKAVGLAHGNHLETIDVIVAQHINL